MLIKKARNSLSRRAIWKNNEGNFTIEASLVLPIVLMVVALLLFLCLYIYQKSFLVQASSAVSERSAFIWDNSHKEAVSGSVPEGIHDPLYWRLTDDHLLGTLFGWGSAGSSSRFSIPGEVSDGGELPVVKMSKAAQAAPHGMRGEISYDNKVLLRKVSTELSWPETITPLARVMPGGLELQVSSPSVIVDPVEFIRTVELMRYYGSKFKGIGGHRTDPGTASEVLRQYGGRK